MLKETETEDIIGFLSHIYDWWHFNWEGPAGSFVRLRLSEVCTGAISLMQQDY